MPSPLQTLFISCAVGLDSPRSIRDSIARLTSARSASAVQRQAFLAAQLADARADPLVDVGDGRSHIGIIHSNIVESSPIVRHAVLALRNTAVGPNASCNRRPPPSNTMARGDGHGNEHVDVLIVGAGLSGIGAAYHLQQKCPDKRYAILEGRAAIGGTWDLFRYPGIRSDSDMFTLGYSFKPWTRREVDRRRPDDPELHPPDREGQRHRAAHPLSPSRQARVVVVEGCALDGGGGAGRDQRGRQLHLQFPVPVQRLLQLRSRATRRSSRASRISRARSSIRRSGPRTSTTPTSAWS